MNKKLKNKGIVLDVKMFVFAGCFIFLIFLVLLFVMQKADGTSDTLGSCVKAGGTCMSTCDLAKGHITYLSLDDACMLTEKPRCCGNVKSD